MSEGSMTTALAPQQETGVDLAGARQKSEAVATVEAQVFMAKQFPRNEDAAYQQIVKTCQRPSFALDATFSFPRGGSTVEGGSIALAREMKRHWGNIDSGNRIVRDDGKTIFGEAFAWDFQTNTRERREFQVSKYIWKRGKRGQPGRHVLVGAQRGEDEKDLERDLREKFQNIAARAERECIFHLMPSDFREEAVAEAKETIRSRMQDDPDSVKKLVIRGMARVNVTAEMMEEFLGCKLAQASPTQIEQLRELYQKIHGGEATWRDLTAPEPPKKEERKTGSIDPDELTASPNPNRGHDRSNPSSPSHSTGGAEASSETQSGATSEGASESSSDSGTEDVPPYAKRQPAEGVAATPSAQHQSDGPKRLKLADLDPDETAAVSPYLTSQAGPAKADQNVWLSKFDGDKATLLEAAGDYNERNGLMPDGTRREPGTASGKKSQQALKM